VEFSIHSLIWSIINFTVFFLLLRWLLYRPVLRLLDARRDEVSDNLARAESARQEAEAGRAEYERRLAQAREEAQAMIRRAQATAERAKDDILSQAQRQSDEMLERAQKAISAEKERALAELRREVADLAVLAASKIIERHLDADEHRRLVDEFVSRLPEESGPAGKTG
jgi:F-type H+-transporting ATPase subunit b